MSSTLSQRRMAENEVVFRQHNERIQEGFEELRKIAKEDNQEHLVEQNDNLLQFYCECADENCTQRVLLKLSRYTEIHKKRNRFVVVQGHDIQNIERVIGQEAGYSIVEKFVTLPDSATKLNKTEADNA